MEITRGFQWSLFRAEKSYVARWGVGTQGMPREREVGRGAASRRANQITIQHNALHNERAQHKSFFRIIRRVRAFEDFSGKSIASRQIFVWSAAATAHPVLCFR